MPTFRGNFLKYSIKLVVFIAPFAGVMIAVLVTQPITYYGMQTNQLTFLPFLC